MNNLIYTDACSELNKKRIKDELGLEVIQGIEKNLWNLNDSLSVIMLPNIKMAVINIINEITVIEMGLLYFMCKPILVTAPTIKDYPVLATKIASYLRVDCDLRFEKTSFIDWYKSWEK
jgi:hypothetical protein